MKNLLLISGFSLAGAALSSLLSSVQDSLSSLINGTSTTISSSISNSQSLLSNLLESYEQDTDTFDYIVIGSGAGGGILSSRLAETFPSASILVIERGGERPAHSLSEKYFGHAVLDPAISEEFFTPEGVRLNVARVLGGGPSINGGLFLQEDSTWLDMVKSDIATRTSNPSATGFDPTIVNQANAWLQQSGLFCDNREGFWAKVRRNANISVGFLPNDLNKSWSIMKGTFGTKTVFCGGTRLGLDTLMRKYSNITIKTQATVARVVFSAGSGVTDALNSIQSKQITASNLLSLGLQASCVDYNSDTPIVKATSITGSLVSTLTSIATGTVNLSNLSISTKRRRVCINAGGRVVLSTGSIHTPAVLIRSGIGPTSQTSITGTPNLMTNNQIGENLSDHMAFGFMVFNNTATPQTGDAALTTQQIYSTMQLGSECTNGEGSVNDPSVPGCQTILTEEISGGKVAVLYLIATLQRFAKKNIADVVLTEAVNTIRDCVVNDNCPSFLDSFFSCLDRAMMVASFLASPKSRGSVTVTSGGDPVVDCGYLSHNDDLLTARAAVRKLTDIIESPPVRGVAQKEGGSCVDVINDFFYSPLNYAFTGYSRPISEMTFSSAPVSGITSDSDRVAVTPPYGPYPATDDRIDEVHRTHFNTIWHYTGTASLGTVTNHLNAFQLVQVSGQPTVTGLSICDASVLPIVSRVNTMATTMMVGYYCAKAIADADAAVRSNPTSTTTAAASTSISTSSILSSILGTTRNLRN